MRFMVVYKLTPENQQAAIARFRETGAPPPDGVEMVGRWHCASMHEGFILAEADSVEAVGSWCYQWADHLSFRVLPVLTDEGLLKAMSP